MARQTRQKSTSSSRKAKPAKSLPAKSAKTRSRDAAKAQGSGPRASARAGTATKAGKDTPPVPRAAQAPAPPPAPPPRKPGYYEALAMYESGVRALQRHDYQGAATQFRTIIERYPDERELQERSHLYLRVCERETARQPATPQTPQERVYAATVALNAGDTSTALDHLRRALTDSPDSDHAHYIMSVALASKGDSGQALEHLRQAISLNPENRALAKQDPDLESVRGIEEFREMLDAPPGTARSKARKKR
jgi:tetratricopeptide (TPR) repeat protein